MLIIQAGMKDTILTNVCIFPWFFVKQLNMVNKLQIFFNDRLCLLYLWKKRLKGLEDPTKPITM